VKNDRYGLPFYDRASEDGRYSTWIIFVYNSISNIDLDLIDRLLSKVFIKYKYTEVSGSETDNDYTMAIVARTSVRKRVGTVARMIYAELAVQYKNRKGRTDNKLTMYKSLVSYERADFGVPLAGSSDTRDEYLGYDIRMLDDRSQRHPWQNSMLDLIYNEKKEEFRRPDDRTITWIMDKNGNTGKSKMVKWLCINRPDEIIKITFGTSSQLKTSLVSTGPKICYIIDIPRTIGFEDKIINLITVVEDLKNGHIVSNMYGKHGQLIMDPPHIIILSNEKCPVKLMSKDRWKRYEINPNSFELDTI